MPPTCGVPTSENSVVQAFPSQLLPKLSALLSSKSNVRYVVSIVRAPIGVIEGLGLRVGGRSKAGMAYIRLIPELPSAAVRLPICFCLQYGVTPLYL